MLNNAPQVVIRGSLGEPYGNMIVDLLRHEFPVLRNGDESQLNAVMAELIGSSQTRNGPRPNPESEVAMREVVRRCITAGSPIPMLVPSGPKKPVQGMSVDIAELAALRTLACLQTRVSRHYPPGLEIVFRMEDVTGWVLEGHEARTRDSIENYLADFEKLVRILDYGNFIFPIRESALVTEEAMRAAIEQIEPTISAYVRDTDVNGLEGYEKLESWQQLKALGWSGRIPVEQRQFYHCRYQRLFPKMTAEERTDLMVRYLANTLARYQLKATGAKPDWEGNFQLSFAAPVPGNPPNLTSTRIYYRTLPLHLAKHHLPFWRARGFLKLNGDAKFSLATWGDKLDLTECAVVFQNEMESVTIRTDYLLV